MQHEKLIKGILFGLIGNLLFVAFGIIILIYYYTYNAGSFFSKVIEVLAYCVELMGFGLLIYADWLLIKSIRLRGLLKFSFSAYIILEAVMMILELNSYKIEAYEPFSLVLAMSHAVASALACFAFLQLDPDNVKWEVAIGACFTLILTGMLGNLFGERIYFSILTNAIGFSVLFAAMKFFHDREELEIDCYGDRAKEAIFSSSTLFSEEKGNSETKDKENSENSEIEDNT